MRASVDPDHGGNQMAKWSNAIGAIILLCSLPLDGRSCTTLSLRSEGGSVVNIMNMEFPANLGYTVNHFPSGMSFEGDVHEGLHPKSWRGRYSVIGTGGKSDPHAIGAGMNERGLFVTTLFLKEGTRYQEITPEDEGKFIGPTWLPTYLLTRYETASQVREAVQEIKVGNISAAGFYGVVPTFHWMVTDRDYNSLVIEYTEGEVEVYDNPHHAMTNAPTFDFHLNNMRNYAFLDSRGLPGPEPAENPTGVGYGTLGMPGDYTPTGRFVRAAFFARTVSGADASITRQAAEVSNALIYPAGIAVYRSDFTHEEATQRTMYSFIANAATREILFRRYGDLSWRVFAFEDFQGSTGITMIEVFDDWAME
jgi:choloylglycine hydrolase